MDPADLILRSAFKKFQAFIDAGSILKDFAEEQVACSFLRFFVNDTINSGTSGRNTIRAAGFFDSNGEFSLAVVTSREES